MTIQEAYTNWASTYDQDPNLTRDLDQHVTREALGTLHFRSILEIGCGTGKNTALLAEIGEQVLAFDFSEGMIARAKEKLQTERVSFAVTDINKRWPCNDGWANLIVCNLVLEHIHDLSLIFAEGARVLKTGGLFFVSELHPFRQYQGTKANFQRNGTTTEIPAFIHHLSDFIEAAAAQGLSLDSFKEWWHEADQNKLPRLVSFIFEKRV